MTVLEVNSEDRSKGMTVSALVGEAMQSCSLQHTLPVCSLQLLTLCSHQCLVHVAFVMDCHADIQQNFCVSDACSLEGPVQGVRFTMWMSASPSS